MSALAELYRLRGHLRDLGPYGYCGRYPDWSSAVAAAAGYDSPIVLEQTRRATALVRDGDAAFQQDGVAMSVMPDYAYRIAFVLAVAALERGGTLSVLDFGGALGSGFYAYRNLFGSTARLTWRVVEQNVYCECGRREFADPQLSFFDTLDAAVSAGRPDVVLCISVLQFLERPEMVLKALAAADATFLVIDRTPFAVGGGAEIVVQRVPPTLYRASYPSWLLSESTFRDTVMPAYDVWLEWEIPSAFTARARFKGFALESKGRTRT
jgi:putative methyltransferase (TIGR04325 family)